MKRYYCTQPHLNGQKGMYHYDDEVIYEKHLRFQSTFDYIKDHPEIVDPYAPTEPITVEKLRKMFYGV